MSHAPLLIALSAGLLAAADRKPEPAPQPPQSVEGRLAKTKFDEAVKKAAQEFDRSVAEARKQYLEELSNLQKAATKAEQLDEAVRIRQWRTVVEQERDGSGTIRGLREGAFVLRGSQYRVFLAEGNWATAREKCQKMGGDLAVVDTKEKRELLGELNGSIELWVGVSKDKGGKWKWVNGQPVEAESWAKGRPQDHGGFAVLFPGGTLGDCREDLPSAKGFICEWKK